VICGDTSGTDHVFPRIQTSAEVNIVPAKGVVAGNALKHRRPGTVHVTLQINQFPVASVIWIFV
jgi:hypothetical protein